MPAPKKVIFLEGVDGAGKTTRAKRLQELNLDVRYFRSNYQVGSSFAGKPVNLEESLNHDWRILHDFIHQASDPDSFIVVDRGFLSSYVYGKVLRPKGVDLWPITEAYLDLFGKKAEYWVFTRMDSEMDDTERQVNDEYVLLQSRLQGMGLTVNRFTRLPGKQFITTDFLDVAREIIEGRLDPDTYAQEVRSFVSDSRGDGDFVMADLDGTLIDSLEAPRRDVIKKIAKTTTDTLVVTGRTSVHIDLRVMVQEEFYKAGYQGIVRFVTNGWNLGMSSRVLKEFILHQLVELPSQVIVLDDRVDVVRHLGREEDETPLASFASGVYCKAFTNKYWSAAR